MKFLIFGLGSMGKRRVRCLQALGYTAIHGFDPRTDRCEESRQKYGITVFSELNQIDFADYDAYIISTPPDSHLPYCKYAVDYDRPAFIEASVIPEEVTAIREYNKAKKLFLAPSCTFKFHPLIKDIKKFVDSGKYGRITNFSYHAGQYLPDWHPWEDVTEFYVSKRETGGAREIVPFELTWLIDVAGPPEDIKGFFQKTMDVGASIEDTYSFLLKYPDKLGMLTIDVSARFAVRNLVLNMERAQIQWRWDDGYLRLYESDTKRWITYHQPEGSAAAGYNKNIVEQIYIDELNSFINGIKEPSTYPNSLDNDIYILNILHKIEESDGGF